MGLEYVIFILKKKKSTLELPLTQRPYGFALHCLDQLNYDLVIQQSLSNCLTKKLRMYLHLRRDEVLVLGLTTRTHKVFL